MSPETNIRNVRKNQNREQILDAWTMVLKNMPHQKTQECNTFANSSTLSKQPCPNQFCVKFIIDDKDGEYLLYVALMSDRQINQVILLKSVKKFFCNRVL